MAANKGRTSTYETKQRWRTWAIRLTLSAVAGGASYLLIHNFEWVWRAVGFEVRFGPVDLRKLFVGWLEQAPLVGGLVKSNPLLIARINGDLLAFAAGAITALVSVKSRSAVLHERFFQPFDDRVLTPIGAAQAYDPLRGAAGSETGKDVPMPFVLPKEGGRRSTWTRLEALSADGDDPRKRFSGPQTAFGWTLLMGRSGSGKSRMAMEFARHLAKSAEPRPTFGRRIASWWRVEVLRKRCGDSHAWEAGWLRPGRHNLGGGPYSEWTGRLGVGGPWLSQLEKWRPRRPTILLLDDPHLEDTRKIVETLDVASASYRHEVRLLVVNQTAPSEMRLSHHADGWRSSGSLNPLVEPMTLPDDGRFEEPDIRALRGHDVLPAKTFPLSRDGNVRQFLKVTEGNPLLVEIALRRLRDGALLADLSRESLVAERVERLLEALEQAGLDRPEHRRAVAAATLADGIGSREIITLVYPLPTGQVGELRRIFPADALDLRTLLPAVRPDAIGDAFVRHVFADLLDGERRALVETAWKASTSGTLRSALRLSRHQDDLGKAMASPPADSGLNPVEVAFAYSEAALRFRIEHGPEPVVDDPPKGLLASATGFLAPLQPGDAVNALERLIDLAAPRQDGTAVRARYWQDLVIAAMGAAGNDGEPPAGGYSRLSAILSSLWLQWTRLLGDGYKDPPSEPQLRSMRHLIDAFGLDDASRQQLLVDAASLQGKCVSHTLGTLVAQAHEEFPTLLEKQPPAAQARSTLATLAWLARRFAPELARRIAEQFAGWSKGSGDVDLLSQATSSGTAAAYSYTSDDPVSDRFWECVRDVEALSAPWPNRRDMQLARARVWRYAAFATVGDAVTCKSHAETVDRIAASWPDDRDMQYERAEAWRMVAFATHQDATAHHESAETVDRIAAPWPDDRDMQYERAQVWRMVALLTQPHETAHRESAEAVDRIAAPWPDDRDIQYERAQVWRAVAFAAKDNAAVCRLHAETIERIAALWPDDRDFQAERMHAWRLVAFGAMKEAGTCRANAVTVDRIAAPWPHDPGIQYERAVAWRFVAAATQETQDTRRAGAETVDRITAAWPNEREMQYERALAWRNIAFALEDPVACRASAETVDRIAAPWPNDREMQYERIRAWRSVVFATTEQHDVCRTTAEMVDRIAERWPQDRDIQRERAEAWRHVVFATREDAMACHETAETVDHIAAPWPDDRGMQYERVQAWRVVAYATRGTPEKSRQHAEAVGRIVARWPYDTEMQEELQRARGFAGLSAGVPDLKLAGSEANQITITFGDLSTPAHRGSA